MPLGRSAVSLSTDVYCCPPSSRVTRRCIPPPNLANECQPPGPSQSRRPPTRAAADQGFRRIQFAGATVSVCASFVFRRTGLTHFFISLFDVTYNIFRLLKGRAIEKCLLAFFDVGYTDRKNVSVL